jgi:hypothetical protein
MQFLRHILIRKVAAFLLMAMLLYIQGVQVFHRHDYTPVKHQKTTQLPGHLVKANHSCAICDYHLAKDAALPAAQVILPSLCYYPVTNTFRPSAPHAGLQYTQANKGPPALL